MAMLTNITLITPRLIIREYQETDFPGIHDFASDRETVQYMTWGPNTPEETRKFIDLAIYQQGIVPRVNFHFVVLLLKTGQIIGGCGIHVRIPDQHTAVVGYCLNKKFWGGGHGTETLGALLKFGFEQVGIHRIEATCDTRNIGSVRVMEKNGMRRKAHFKQHIWQKGEWRDSYLYAILGSEWKGRLI
jgi:ribosomal-protein-alanine N-acetyltransferase